MSDTQKVHCEVYAVRLRRPPAYKFYLNLNQCRGFSFFVFKMAKQIFLIKKIYAFLVSPLREQD
ncbi:hypothetical protein AUK13_02015 [Candidatus Kuenenbacteria bacterium CG2_30_39_24]|uniref:Uncharacterized protein n=1 Tax=Candidatus Kuenenbacteria bacterium CG2_30_39_24 TaxID=1805236 RepID=A0A1J5F7I5_9BACT|nr:MAG: hypothetical protein AUK13_02015 [Candidatus Kuenenbacteria bacterium CG2_30_39_24]